MHFAIQMHVGDPLNVSLRVLFRLMISDCCLALFKLRCNCCNSLSLVRKT
uniref:Uncharacterized protein n=1 Tax=Parascaris equorum TaxID=6256 RepID=A0A914RR87_PAREQ